MSGENVQAIYPHKSIPAVYYQLHVNHMKAPYFTMLLKRSITTFFCLCSSGFVFHGEKTGESVDLFPGHIYFTHRNPR